jgi:hypothetical protein
VVTALGFDHSRPTRRTTRALALAAVMVLSAVGCSAPTPTIQPTSAPTTSHPLATASAAVSSLPPSPSATGLLEYARFVAGAATSVARDNPSGVVLQDGNVLDIGGCARASAELCETATARFVATGETDVIRTGSSAVALLKDGRVLVTGGSTGVRRELRSKDRRVLIAGGADRSAELFDVSGGAFELTGSMNAVRSGGFACLLTDGRVLVAGGAIEPADGRSSEIFLP